MALLYRTGSALRLAAVLGLGAFAVHQLRYVTGYGAAAGDALAAQGHGYLSRAPATLIAFVLAALAITILGAVCGRPGAARRRALGRSGRIAAYAAAIVAVYAVQELAEGALSAGHPGGLEGLLGSGGLVVLPLAAAFGRLVALLADGLQAVEERACAAAGPRLPRTPRLLGRTCAAAARPLTSLTLAFGLARRPPPSSALTR